MPEVRHTLTHFGLVHPQVANAHDALAVELEARFLRQRHKTRGREPTLHDELQFLRQAEILVNARRRNERDY